MPTYGDLSESEFEGAQPLTIFEDNQGTIDLSRKPGALHKRSKHISIRYHWIRERIASGELKLSKIDTSLNTADIFTKATSNQTFIFLRDKLLHPRETVERKESANIADQDHVMGPTRCLICGKEGHLEPDCPIYKRPDEYVVMGTEFESKGECVVEDTRFESKHSESLLVARPDGQHKGSNDRGSAGSQTEQSSSEEQRVPVAHTNRVPGTVWAIIRSLSRDIVALERRVAQAQYELRRLRSSTSQGSWRASATCGET